MANPNDLTTVVAHPAVLSYPFLIEPRRTPDKKTGVVSEQYDCELYIYQSNPKYMDIYQKLMAAMSEACRIEWPDGKIPAFNHPPIKDLATKNDESLPPGFFIRCKSFNKPAVVKADKNAPPGTTVSVPVDSVDECYAGVVVAFNVRAQAYNIKAEGARGVTWYLNTIWLLQDGPRLGQSTASPDEVFSSMVGEFAQYSGVASAADKAVGQMGGMPQGAPGLPQMAPQQMMPQVQPPQAAPFVMPGQQMMPQGMPGVQMQPQQMMPQGMPQGVPQVQPGIPGLPPMPGQQLPY